MGAAYAITQVGTDAIVLLLAPSNDPPLPLTLVLLACSASANLETENDESGDIRHRMAQGSYSTIRTYWRDRKIFERDLSTTGVMDPTDIHHYNTVLSSPSSSSLTTCTVD